MSQPVTSRDERVSAARTFLFIAGLWVALWVLQLAVGDNLAIGDQERQCAYILDALTNGHWSAQTDFKADMASKPPLYNWLGAAAVAAFGPTHLAFTFPAALSTLVLALLAARWSQRLWGPWAGPIAGTLMLLPMVGVKMVTYVRTDGLFAATVALTAYAWWRHWERGAGWWWPWLAAVAATLTKGPLGLLVGSLGLLAVFWRSVPASQAGGAAAASSPALSRRWPAGLLAYLVLSGGWFAWAWLQWGQPLVDRMIVRELVGHALASRDSAGGVGSQFYKAPLYLLWRTFPWCVFTVLAVIRVFREPDADPVRRRAERFLTCWLLGGTLMFALASHQRGDLIWPVVLPSAVLAASEVVRRAPRWPAWVRTRLAPVLLALTLVVVALNQVADGRPRKSVYAEDLARAIERGPGAYFPISYAVKYVTQARLGIHRYLVPPERHVATLTAAPAAYLAVEDPGALVRGVTAAGGRAWVLLESRGGWGIVGNRPGWEAGPALRLAMGPVDVEVQQGEWLELRGREILVRPVGTAAPVVKVVNDGPHTERFVARVGAAGEREELVVPPGTTLVARRDGGKWRVALSPR